MDILEPIRRGYHALGFGADSDVLGMLDQDGPEPARWEIRGLDVRRGGTRPAGEAAALDLFGVFPAQFELVGAQVTNWSPSERYARLVVSGSFRLRVRGSFETIDLPFSHVWSFANGRVKDVLNVGERFQLRRLPPIAQRAA